MPARVHEALIDFVTQWPGAVLALLQAAGKLPSGQMEVESAQRLSLAQPNPGEARPDLIIVVKGTGGPMALVVEVQRRRDADKARSWPLYVLLARQRLRMPARLLVLATSDSVARWAAKAIPIGGPGEFIHPIVLVRADLPQPTPARAEVNPPLALLAALLQFAEATDPAAAFKVAMLAIEHLAPQWQFAYTELALALLPDELPKDLEERMRPEDYRQPIVQFAVRRYLLGKQDGLAEGKAEGKAEGTVEGELNALRRTLRRWADKRGLVFSTAELAAIDACADADLLSQWLDNVATAGSVGDVFAVH